MTSTPLKVSISLVSHTNAGKTTLLRTLLGRNVGEVRDAPHVTELAEGHQLVSTENAQLWLWDTPGFGDSLRVARRLQSADHPLGWFLREVWDRFRDRPLWCSQQAIRNARDEADAVLYLVNASEAPAEAGYVDAEMQILTWIGKPILVTLNQMGPSREAALENADVERWRQHLAKYPLVRQVLPLDAFARCWVQESALWLALEQALPMPLRAPMASLHRVWRARREQVFTDSIDAIAEFLGRVAADREAVEDGGFGSRVRDLIAGAMSRSTHENADERARSRLALRLDDVASTCLDRLIALHGLDGSARAHIAEELVELYAIRAPVSEGKAALFGGAVSGALAGLKADLVAGGMSFGAGLLIGSVLGALGAAGIARGVNRIRGTDTAVITWNGQALERIARDAMLRYLAVAHFGRGRGSWREVGVPAHWSAAVDAEFAAHHDGLQPLWDREHTEVPDPAQLRPVLHALGHSLLARLYPDAPGAHGTGA